MIANLTPPLKRDNELTVLDISHEKEITQLEPFDVHKKALADIAWSRTNQHVLLTACGDGVKGKSHCAHLISMWLQVTDD